MTSALKRYFPENRADWKFHLKIFIPILLGSILYALNGFVDNFMVGNIEQGVTALSAVNSWTNIMIGFLTGATAAGSILMGQFYYSGHYAIAKELARLRMLATFSLSLILSIVCWAFPDQMIGVFLKGDGANHEIAMQAARDYLRIITLQWLLMSITGTFGDTFKEIGYGRATVYWGVGTLLTNITLNSILMYGFSMGTAGAAWASVVARCVALSVAIFWIYRYKLVIGFKPWTIFKISKRTLIVFLNRWYIFASFTTIVFFITFRNFFYDWGYTVNDNSKLGSGVSAMMVLGLTGAIQNIFTTTFGALSSMAAIFVGAKLGNKEFKEAKKNSDILKGFNTSMSLILGLLLISVASFLPYMTFLSNDNSGASNINHAAHLIQTRNSCYVIAIFYPTWIWFSTSYRNAITGGRGFWFAATDWIVSGPFQLAYLAFLMVVVVPSSEILQSNFAIAYALFFLSDFLKLIIIEILYYKTNWMNTIVKDSDK